MKYFLINLVTIFLAQLNLSFLTTNQAIAADKVILRYGIFSEDVTNKQLEEFALTGDLDTPLGDFLRQNHSISFILQNSLKQEIPINLVALDKALNHTIGDFLLDYIGQIIQMPAGSAHKQAIRAALILSAQDNQLSILEVIKNYPDEQIIVDGEKLEKLQDNINISVKLIQSFFSKNK
ncbi:alpha/beta hydrolase [Pseudanabaena sp. ABRG5-3]|uniref:alpha/beta hydrolase n=1 Tax=Pseudanabaena sp. ABRG5-3 TaxID=685565 RepID=UPI000DC7255D|nr:alpha/beta hydrolase [Pseudanabaena sp. ABRG5-3]BBC24263.1 dienelactone hydrolase [Pseudanabaena sp. ABRG5-3]